MEVEIDGAASQHPVDAERPWHRDPALSASASVSGADRTLVLLGRVLDHLCFSLGSPVDPHELVVVRVAEVHVMGIGALGSRDQHGASIDLLL